MLCKKLQMIQVDASTTTWIIDYLTNRPQFVKLKGWCVWEGGQQHWSSLSSLRPPQTSGTIQSPVISRNTQMALQLLGGSVMDERLSTGNWSIPLWPGVIDHCVEYEQNKKKMIFRRIRNKANTVHPKRRNGGSWRVELPGSLPGQQTGLERQHWGRLQKRT